MKPRTRRWGGPAMASPRQSARKARSVWSATGLPPLFRTAHPIRKCGSNLFPLQTLHFPSHHAGLYLTESTTVSGAASPFVPEAHSTIAQRLQRLSLPKSPVPVRVLERFRASGRRPESYQPGPEPRVAIQGNRLPANCLTACGLSLEICNAPSVLEKTYLCPFPGLAALGVRRGFGQR